MGHYSHHFYANQISANYLLSCEIENIYKATQHTATGQRALSLLLILSASITSGISNYCYYFLISKLHFNYQLSSNQHKSIFTAPLQIWLLFSDALALGNLILASSSTMQYYLSSSTSSTPSSFTIVHFQRVRADDSNVIALLVHKANFMLQRQQAPRRSEFQRVFLNTQTYLLLLIYFYCLFDYTHHCITY